MKYFLANVFQTVLLFLISTSVNGSCRYATDDRPLAAHFTLDPKELDQGKLAWRPLERNNETVIHSAISYEAADGLLDIQRSGLYHAYLTVALHRHRYTKDYSDLPLLKFTIGLAKKSTGPDGQRLKTRWIMTGHKTLREGDMKTILLKGTFQLNEGDRLLTFVPYPELINRLADESASILGLIEVSRERADRG